MKLSWLLTVCFLGLGLVPSTTSPQSSSPQSPVEISGEAHHHPKFENEFVRVWDVTVPAGEATASFVASTKRVKRTKTVSIRASYNGGSVSAALTVNR